MGANASSSGSGYPTMPSSGSNAGGGGCLLPNLTSSMTAGSTGSGGGPGPSRIGGLLDTNLGLPHYREQRRKRVTGFATLKRKFIRRRRSSKACDHARVLRDFVSDWTPLELAALCEEYEALAALRDLSMQAELARPPATTYKQDLAALYEHKTCTDCDLVFRGNIFPVHRAILSSRCSYFRELLQSCPGFGARFCLELPASPIDVSLFSSLLRYLYTGDLCPHDPSIDINLLRQLGNDFGTPNALEHDLRYLLETGDYADAALVFTAEGNDYQRPDSGSSEYGFRPKLELPCHKAILSARSAFFRNLIARRTRNMDEYTERALHVPTRIVLDETVIPKRYARVLLHAIYLDTVDLTLILRGANSGAAAGSLGEVHALTNTGRTRPTPLEEAMELFQIGRFLELDILAQGCEDLILEWLSLETLPTVLKWGSQPHGSAWVFRQACQYLREEFSSVAASPVLHQLDKNQLIHVLQSNFLQASELEVLQGVLKWGEQELIRRMEDREPNLLSHTAHSVARKGVKKRDLSDVELREILSELLPLVRMDHVLPPNSEILSQAIRRGLVSTPPSHMIGDDRENLRINAWIRGGKNQGLFVRPRLFMPYFEEIKALLEDRMASSSHQQAELMRLRRSRHMPDIPDTLYMVSRMNHGCTSQGEVGTSIISATCGGPDSLDMLAAAASLPPPDSQTLSAMLKREYKLRQTPMCQRALMLPLSSKHEIDRQIRLRVAREFNYPDAISELLESSYSLNHQMLLNDLVDNNGGNVNTSSALQNSSDDCLLEDDDQSPPPSPAATSNPNTSSGNGLNIPRHNLSYLNSAAKSSLSSLTTTGGISGISGASAGSSLSSSCGLDGLQQSCYSSRNLTFPRQQQQQQPHHSNHSPNLLNLNSLTNNQLVATMQANYARLSASVHHHHHRNDLPALITEGVDYRFLPHGGNALVGMDLGAEGAAALNDLNNPGGNGAAGHLSDMMPDVAMATASMGQLHLSNNVNNSLNAGGNGNGVGSGSNNSGSGAVGLGGNNSLSRNLNNSANNSNNEMPESLQLDLGDGPSHMLNPNPHPTAGPSGLRGFQHQQQLSSNNYHHYMHRSNSPFDILRQGQHSPAPSSSHQHPSSAGTYNTGPPRFL